MTRPVSERPSKRGCAAVKVAGLALSLVVLDALFRFLDGANAWGPWFLTTLLAGVTVPVAVCLLLRALARRDAASGFQVALQVVLLALLCALVPINVYPAWFPPKQFFALGARWRIRCLSNEARLQSWAQTLLALPPSQLPLKDRSQLDQKSNRLDLDPKQLPEFVATVADTPQQIGVREEYEGARYIRIHLGGWVDGHWNLMLGGAELERVAASRGWQRWREGVYLDLR